MVLTCLLVKCSESSKSEGWYLSYILCTHVFESVTTLFKTNSPLFMLRLSWVELPKASFFSCISFASHVLINFVVVVAIVTQFYYNLSKPKNKY